MNNSVNTELITQHTPFINNSNCSKHNIKKLKYYVIHLVYNVIHCGVLKYS